MGKRIGKSWTNEVSDIFPLSYALPCRIPVFLSEGPCTKALFLLQHEEAWRLFYDEFKVYMIKGLEEAEAEKAQE